MAVNAERSFEKYFGFGVLIRFSGRYNPKKFVIRKLSIINGDMFPLRKNVKRYSTTSHLNNNFKHLQAKIVVTIPGSLVLASMESTEFENNLYQWKF